MIDGMLPRCALSGVATRRRYSEQANQAWMASIRFGAYAIRTGVQFVELATLCCTPDVARDVLLRRALLAGLAGLYLMHCYDCMSEFAKHGRVTWALINTAWVRGQA